VLCLLEQRPRDVEIHRELADLALGRYQLAVLDRPRARLQALTSGGEELLAPLSDPPRGLAALARQQVKRLAAQQPQHDLLLAPGRPAHLALSSGCALGALVSIPASMTPDIVTSSV